MSPELQTLRVKLDELQRHIVGVWSQGNELADVVQQTSPMGAPQKEQMIELSLFNRFARFFRGP